MSAKWIVLEGIEGTGKTTLGKLLAKELHGVYISTNSQGPIAQAVRERFKDKNKPELPNLVYAHMMASTITETFYDYIKPMLDKGVTVISDRWLPSFYVYQVCKGAFDPLINNIFSDLSWLVNKQHTPDMYVHCTLPLNILEERLKKRGRDDRLDNLDLDNKFDMLSNFDYYLSNHVEDITYNLDCSGTIEQNLNTLLNITQARLFREN